MTVDEIVVSPQQAELYARCEEKIEYTFVDKALLQAALTHASGAEHRLASNERLEFLGDAILGTVVCELLFRLSKLFGRRFDADQVDRSESANVRKMSEAMGIQECLILGKGMTTNPSIPPSLLADAFESLAAAIYLDGGTDPVRDFLHRNLLPEIELAAGGELGNNYKSMLQQLAQREHGTTPTYQLLDEKGPDHSKCFQIAAQVGANRYPAAWGRNKKEAEQRAARNALCSLGGKPMPNFDGT